MTYVYMKTLEKKAERYDRGIKILTFGRIQKIKKYLVSKFVEPGNNILDIGMGTGTFAIECMRMRISFTGLDKSEKMLEVARKNLSQAGYIDNLIIHHMSVVEMDNVFKKKEFDKVFAILSFSEMYQKERIFCLKEINRVLKDEGEFILVDEVRPKSLFKRILYNFIRIPLLFVTLISTNRTTLPIDGFEEKLNETHLEIIEKQSYLLDSLVLLRIRKKKRNIF